MNRRQKIIISVTGIFLVLLILVGLTYAYFLTQIQGNEEERSISVTTANLVLEYGDGNGILETDKLEPSNDFIKFKDSEGNLVDSKIFTVTNKGNATVEGYKVYLENVQNGLERKDDFVYTLSCKAYTNYGEETQAEIETGCNGVSTETTFPSVITSIVTNDINVGVTHFYELKAKYKEMNVDQSIDMNKLITAKINIYDASTKFLAREILDNAASTATVTYNKTSYIEPSLQDGIERNGITYTIPAEQINNETERIMTYTFDDLGTSYYFRGNVEDNYVNFASMCWRIVRIEGDGSIKLILEDQDQLCNSKDTDGNLNMDGNWSDGNRYYFGYDENKNADFINYSGDDGLANSFETFQNTLAKKINKNLTDESTQTEINNVLANNLKLDEWCYDNQLIEIDEAGTKNFSSNVRILTNKKPSLKCNGTILTKFKDNTDMYVATLTVDESSFAGVSFDMANNNFYLLNSHAENNSIIWWMLSLGNKTSLWDQAFFMTNTGLLRFNFTHTSQYSRPAVTLKAGSEILEGIGTLEKPYIITID